MKQLLLVSLCLITASIGMADERVLAGLSEIKGTTTNYKIKNSDGLADFSIVIPAMNAEELVNFDMGRVFSPETDTIKVFTYTLDLPSNLSVPKQTESYFLSFTIEKNVFRSYLPNGEQFNMYALRGQFPVSDVVKGVQNKKSLFELVNFFKFYGAGTKSAKANGSANVEIPIDDISFNSTFNYKAPTYAAGKVVLALGLYKSNGEYYPTDVKRVTSGQAISLTTRSGVTQYALSLLLSDEGRSFVEEFDGDISAGIWSAFETRATDDFAQLSYALQKVSGTTTPTLLANIPAPTFNKSQGKLTAQAPKAVAGVSPIATHIVLSEREAGTGIVPVSFKQTLWSTTVSGWGSNFTLPAEALSKIKNKSYSLEVIYMGTTGDANADFSWDNVTHVTRNGIIL